MQINNLEIFFPNTLTRKEVNNLSGWKLKVALMHFGVSRGDCVRFNYGYSLLPSCKFQRDTIHLVADRDGVLKQPIDLGDELDWDNCYDLLSETDINVYELFRDYIKRNLRKAR